MKANRFAALIFCYICCVCSLSYVASASASCPVTKPKNLTEFHRECYYNESQINVTVFQYLHDVTGDVHVNYTVEHNLQEIPIAFDIYLNGQYEQSVECSNENILDRQGMEILKVIFKEMCKDPAFIIKKNLTVNLTLGIDMKLNEDQPCNTVTIGPQRFNLSIESDSESGKVFTLLHLWNDYVDICNRSGPEVPIRITTSTNTSVTLHPSDNNKTKGDIAVWQLQCSHNRTSEQVYKVVVESTENYTVSAEILFSLLPQQCIVVYVSTPAAGSEATPSIPLVGIIVPIIVGAVILVGIIGIVIIAVCSKGTKGGLYTVKVM